MEASRRLGQRSGQDRPEPGRELGVAPSPKLLELRVRDQEILLNQIRWVDPPASSGVDLESSEQAQIIRYIAPGGAVCLRLRPASRQLPDVSGWP
jgi:hypothetical protein